MQETRDPSTLPDVDPALIPLGPAAAGEQIPKPKARMRFWKGVGFVVGLTVGAGIGLLVGGPLLGGLLVAAAIALFVFVPRRRPA